MTNVKEVSSLEEFLLDTPEAPTNTAPRVIEAPSLEGFLVDEEDQALPSGPTTTPSEPTVLNASSLEDYLAGPTEQEEGVLSDVLSEYDRDLTKEDFLKDDRLMDIVYGSLEARYRPSSVVGAAYRGVSGVAGGDTGGGALGPRDYRKMDKEEAFEIWQNYQRSFAGGQTVTTANEVTYGLSADESIKAKLGAGYLAFDRMGNAFTGEGSWSEMGDAILDYGKAAIYDPATILSFGIGKALSFGGTKAAGVAARSVLIKGYQEYLKKGMTKTAARQAVTKAVAKAAPVTAADAMINMGADVAYQSQLIKTGAQEEYSGAQTAIAAAGAMAIPALFAGAAGVKQLRKSKYLEDSFVAYKEFDDDVLKLGADEAEKILEGRVDADRVSSFVSDNFELKSGDTSQFLNWDAIKEESLAGIVERGEQKVDIEAIDSFYKRFFFGNPDENKAGFYQALKESGFVVHESMIEKYGTTTGVWGQAINSFLTDESAAKAMKAFEKSTGEDLGLEYTAKALSDNFIKRTSTAGSILFTPSHLSRMEKMGVSPQEALKTFNSRPDKDAPKRQEFALSIYKRLITSHLNTTGANLKGFTQLISLNTAADFVTGAANFGQGSWSKIVKGDAAEATKYYNRAWGSTLGAIRRGVSVISPELEYRYAKLVLEQSPETTQKLFRDVAGDGGVNDALKHFNLDKSKVAGGVDAVTKGAQTVTLVRMQDEISKTWAFGNNLNQSIMREYGVSPEKFFQREDVSLEMATDRFKANVLDKAAFRTLRETASVNWSTLPANGFFRSAASSIEYFTNKTPVGYIVPFGSFMNTTIATAADLTGVNAARFSLKKLTGKDLDFTTQEGAESFGKMVAGWGAIGLGVYATGGAIDRIQNGLAYNQDRTNDGSIKDRTFDWPVSTMRLTSQIIGYASKGSQDVSKWDFSEVPADLFTELGLQLGGQAVRDLTDFEQSLAEYGQNILDMKESQIVSGEFVGEPLSKAIGVLEDLALPMVGKFFQGATRALDPVNQVYGLYTDSNMSPDMRQGPEKANNAFRYINNLFTGLPGASSELPKRATPTRGLDRRIDIGKQLGIRGGEEPNLIEAMLNSAGRPSWKAIRFDGPAEVKNYMDTIVAPFLETSARKYLSKNPDYFQMSTSDKKKVLDSIIAESKKNVMGIMKSSPVPRSLEMVRVLSGENQEKVKKVMSFIGIEGELEDVLKEEDAINTLKKIQMFVDNYDDIFYGDLKLD